MIKGKIVYFILGIVVITAIILRLVQFFNKDNNQAINNTGNIAIKNFSEELEAEQKFVLEGTVPSSTEKISTSSVNNVLAIITEPQANSIISSPLIIRGEAPGSWFFESSFPVKLVDSDNNLIAITAVSAKGDALTEKFVPYETLLEFNTTATSGYLVLTNDNPSGLPEYELSVKIPVLFLNK